jgi:AcrR family transcriptional regulator
MDGMTSAKPLRADAERNRRKLLDAAAELFARKGLGVGLDEIARCAGVGVGTAYRRFPDKEQLITALFDDRLEQIASLAERCAAREDAYAGLVEFIEGNVELQSTDQGLKELILGSPHAIDRVRIARGRIEPAVESLVSRAQAAGQIRADVAHTDLALVQFMLTAISDIARDADPEAWRRALRLVLDGLRTPEPGPMPGAPIARESLDRLIRGLPRGTRR